MGIIVNAAPSGHNCRPCPADPDPALSRKDYGQGFEIFAAIAATPHLATWDDHDCGPNNSNASFALKGETLKLFRRGRLNPDIGLPGVPGTQVAGRQFGLIRVTGPADERRLSLERCDGAGEPLWRHEIRAKDLRFPRRRGKRP
jgi:hypothetical protein